MHVKNLDIEKQVSQGNKSSMIQALGENTKTRQNQVLRLDFQVDDQREENA